MYLALQQLVNGLLVLLWQLCLLGRVVKVLALKRLYAASALEVVSRWGNGG